MSKQSQNNIEIPQIDRPFSIVLKRKILCYSIAELFWHLTLIDGGSAMWLNTRPLPHNPLRGHEKHQCTSKQPTHCLPFHPTWHMWDSTDHNNGSTSLMVKMLECLFTSGSLLACPSVVCSMAGGFEVIMGAERMPCPGECEERRPYWQHLLFKTHGQNPTKECLIRNS